MNRTCSQMSIAIGQVVEVRMETFTVDSIVVDVKQAYGNVRLLVHPVQGQGEAWVDVNRCSRVEVGNRNVSVR